MSRLISFDKFFLIRIKDGETPKTSDYDNDFYLISSSIFLTLSNCRNGPNKGKGLTGRPVTKKQRSEASLAPPSEDTIETEA